jgi:hypothetical protein
MSTETDTEPIESLYFRWLYDQVVPELDIEGVSSYWRVCSIMHSMVFKDLVEYDSNRIAEVTTLRDEFLMTLRQPNPHDRADVLFPDATIFEVLVMLAKRANLMVEMDLMKWFQLFLKNLKLDRYSDWYCVTGRTGGIHRTLERFNNRTYRPNGQNGGLFPLAHPLKDQRTVELWYQMGAFMNENMLQLEQ